MLNNMKYKVEGLTLSKGGCIHDQTFVDDIAFYLKGTHSNLSKTWIVVDLFCFASEAKINLGKSIAIWASKEKRDWEWGQKVGLKWIPESEGVRYLGIQVDF
jgi:hypothetical protein